jgi:hypothetical protein
VAWTQAARSQKIDRLLRAALQLARSIQRQVRRFKFAGGDEKPIGTGRGWHNSLHKHCKSTVNACVARQFKSVLIFQKMAVY